MPERYFLIDPDGHTVASVTPADFRRQKVVADRRGQLVTYEAAGYRLGGHEQTGAPFEEPAARAAEERPAKAAGGER